MLRKKEIEFFVKNIDGAKTYFEYGSGYSTILASNIPGINTIFSVDSCYEWINETSNKIENTEKNIYFLYCDIGSNCKNLGAPFNGQKKSRWHNYPEAIDHINFIPDCVLIDGRFRVASAIKTHSKVSLASKIFIHDYDRADYYIVEEFFTKVDQVETLAMFQKKDINQELLFEFYNKYKDKVS
jgi:hypothetical protein